MTDPWAGMTARQLRTYRIISWSFLAGAVAFATAAQLIASMPWSLVFGIATVACFLVAWDFKPPRRPR